MLNKIEDYLNDFIKCVIEENIEIYNEFSLQHELGIYLRERFKDTGYLIQFERNVSYFGIDKSKLIKKEIDLSIFDSELNKKYAIELKYPMNGQYPETMYSFIKDICFCEQLTQSGFDGAIAFTIANDKLFFEGSFAEDIYSYFRSSKPIKGIIKKPTGSIIEEIMLDREYKIKWNDMKGSSKYYVVSTLRDDTEATRNLLIRELESKRIVKSTNNMGIHSIKEHIRDTLTKEKNNNVMLISLVSGDLHNELGLVNSMPSVCAAMIKVMEDFPGSELIKPEKVIKFSSTIQVTYKLI